jgi:hypothetical protein
MAYKNPLRLAKNGHFFVSEATTLTSYHYFLSFLPDKILFSAEFAIIYTL